MTFVMHGMAMPRMTQWPRGDMSLKQRPEDDLPAVAVEVVLADTNG